MKEKTDLVRIYADGVFDFMHSGHFNALRQASKLGDVLVVGVVSDEECALHKGPTVFTCKERADMIRKCKWVDEVIEDVVYYPTLQTVEDAKCDFYSHGDDIIYYADGTDSLSIFRDAGKLRLFKRTRGVSTTNIVGRLLRLENQFIHKPKGKMLLEPVSSSEIKSVNDIPRNKGQESEAPPTSVDMSQMGKATFLATTHRIMQFSNHKEPKPNDRVVYLDGGFDLMHEGHLELIEKAKALGDFLYIGVHENSELDNPMMSLHERVLMCLANKDVDDVLIGAPAIITEALINGYGIHTVVACLEYGERESVSEEEAYAIPKAKGIFQIIEVESKMNLDVIVRRIFDNREKHLEKIAGKQESEKKITI